MNEILVGFRPSREVPWAVVTIDGDKHDPFEICNAARARIFPDVKLPQRDEKLEAVMRRRQERQQ